MARAVIPAVLGLEIRLHGPQDFPKSSATYVGSSLNDAPVSDAKKVRHPYRRDPNRDANFENYPCSRLLGLVSTLFRRSIHCFKQPNNNNKHNS